MKKPPSIQAVLTEEDRLIADCLRYLAGVRNGNLALYLEERGVAAAAIPAITARAQKVAQAGRAAKTRMQEGGVITTLGLGGVAYATASEKDGTVWLLWSMVGLGIWANGWWKRKKIKQYY